MFADLRRLLLYAALLPQILVLGLGRGVVLCMATDGHVRVEIASSACCDELGAPAEGEGATASDPSSASHDDCGPCVDVRLSVEPSSARGGLTGELQDFDAPAAPLGAAWPLAPPDAALVAAPRPPDGERVCGHLIRLRSVELHC